MLEPMNQTYSIVLIGIGATAVMDLWGMARKPLLGIPRPDYGMIGRWVGHMARGRFRHASIAASPALASEHTIGWVVHYLTGIAYAGLLVAIGGDPWLRQPTPLLPMAVGIGTVVMPFLVMQPAMGAGIASRRAKHPASARLQSLMAHASFGFGLFVAAWVMRKA